MPFPFPRISRTIMLVQKNTHTGQLPLKPVLVLLLLYDAVQ